MLLIILISEHLCFQVKNGIWSPVLSFYFLCCAWAAELVLMWLISMTFIVCFTSVLLWQKLVWSPSVFHLHLCKYESASSLVVQAVEKFTVSIAIISSSMKWECSYYSYLIPKLTLVAPHVHKDWWSFCVPNWANWLIYEVWNCRVKFVNMDKGPGETCTWRQVCTSKVWKGDPPPTSPGWSWVLLWD